MKILVAWNPGIRVGLKNCNLLVLFTFSLARHTSARRSTDVAPVVENGEILNAGEDPFQRTRYILTWYRIGIH